MAAQIAPLSDRLADHLRPIPDFPKPGILFQDITPVLADSDLFASVVGWYVRIGRDADADAVACVEARGFLFGAAVALRGSLPLVPLRKPGKLPAETLSETYELEYGTDALELHADALAPGMRVLLVDDVLATGGTLAAACRLVEKAGATLAAVAVAVAIKGLPGLQQLDRAPCHVLATV